MSDKSKIEWTDATWNPVTGCTKVSEGCRNCYALKFAERWRGKPGHYFENGFDVQLRPGKLDEPLKWKRPRRIFVNSMSDLFHPKVPFAFIDQVFAVMSLTPHHTFQVLSKRPERMFEYFNVLGRQEVIGHEAMSLYEALGGRGDCSLAAGLIYGPGKISNLPHIPPHPEAWPLPNVWLGVSVENQNVADNRIHFLNKSPAAVRFLSCEPLLGPLDLRVHLAWKSSKDWETPLINWVIAGGESGPGARPVHPDWIRSLRDQCQAAGAAFFFKQWGEWIEANLGNVDRSKEMYLISPEGTNETDLPINEYSPGTVMMSRLSKRAAGRLLDGRTWDEFPA